jgi:hypothetical protein
VHPKQVLEKDRVDYKVIIKDSGNQWAYGVIDDSIPLCRMTQNRKRGAADSVQLTTGYSERSES